MNVLEKLIRFHRYELDAKRRELRILEEREAAVRNAIGSLDDQVGSERVAAKQSQAGLSAYGGFARAALDRRADLLAALQAATQATDAARDAVLDAFAELKRFEISLDRRRFSELRDRERREQDVLDEAAIVAHRRR